MRRASGPFLIEGCFIVDQKLVVFNEDGSTRKIGLHSAEVLIFYTPLQKKTKVPNVFDKKVNFYTPRPKKKTKVHNVFDEKKKVLSVKRWVLNWQLDVQNMSAKSTQMPMANIAAHLPITTEHLDYKINDQN